MNTMINFFTPSSSKGIDSKLYPSTETSNRRNKASSPIITVDESTKEEKVANPQSETDEKTEKNLKETKPIKIINSKIEEKLNSIVPIAIKQNPVFKNELAYLSRSDAHHDLGELFKDTMYKKEDKVRIAFDSGLPVPAIVAFHEGDAFASVVISATDSTGNTINIHTGNNKQEDYLQEALNQVPDCTARDTGTFSTFAIGVGGDIIFKYRVVKFVTQCSNNTNFKGGENLAAIACKSDFGKTFVTNTKLGEDVLEAAIIVDFSQHHFMEDLANGASDNFKIHYLMTPEVVNDPAGKPNVNNKSLFGIQDKGIKLISYVQTDPEPISYTKYNQFEPSTSNNFFSNYDFTLSPIKQIFTKQKAEKLIATLNISYDGAGGKPLTDTIEDSKGENSITTVLGFLKKILTQIQGSSGGSPIEKFNFNSKIQQKRGGDWFQALSCLTAKNRTYTQILPDNNRTSSSLNPTCPVYLVTHDRIAVAFALLNGVNVIYLDYYGRIFIFKNGGDPTLKSSGKTMEEILFEGIKNSWKIDDSTVTTFPDLLKTADIYMTTRNEYVKEEQDKFTALITKLISDVTRIDSNKDGDFQTGVMKIVRELFRAAVKLAFIDINLIDIQGDLSIINSNNQRLFSGEYNPDQSADIAQFSKALNNVNSIQDRFGSMKLQPAKVTSPEESDPNKFKVVIPAWVDGNVTKLDVYRFANKLLDDLQDNKGFNIDRLLCIFSTDNTEMRQTDSHIFLPFIQILNDANKRQIINVINPLIDKTTTYYTSVVAVSRSGRGGESSQKKYYNGVANLLYESMIFLKPKTATPSTTTAASSPSDSTKEDTLFKDKEEAIKSSTDNRLLDVDYKELEQLRGPGKFSGNTETAPDIPVSSSGGGRFADISIQERKTSVICDVSVKQVTWTLLTANLIDSTESDAINNFLKKIKYELDLDELEVNEEGKKQYALIKDIQDIKDAESITTGILGTTYFIINKIGGLLTTNKKGGAPPENLMLDFDLGVHPLTPIYSMLTSYYNIIGEKSQTDPFFYTYFTYINVLEKMKKIIEEKYLIDVNNKVTVAAAYMIGFGLYTMLFASHTSLIQNNEIMSVIQMSQQEYHDFSLKNDCFASTFSGAIIQTPEDEAIGLALISNKLFSNFINNEVNIKQILQEGTSVDNLPDYTVLKERMFKLMGEIVVKVNADRGTPIGATTLSTTATTLSTDSQPTDSTALPTDTSSSASGIAGISQEEAASRAARGQQKYEENVAKGIIKPQGIQDTSKLFTYSQGEPGNVVTSTTGSKTRVGGKRRSKRYLINKRKTIKKRSNKKTNTKKHYRRPRRTKKY